MHRVFIAFFLLIISGTRHAMCSDTLETLANGMVVPAPPPENKGYGTITITTTPEESVIYLDGKKVGTGSATLSNYPDGYHQLYVYNKKKFYEELVFVPANEKTSLKVDFKRIVNVLAIPSFTLFVNQGLIAYGPSFDIGLKFKKQYFGINYAWAFMNAREWPDFDDDLPQKRDYAGVQGGSSIYWNYTVLNLENFLFISPGVTSGFWMFKGREYTGDYIDPYTGQTEKRYDYYKEYLFLGPSLNIKISYKFIFVDIDYAALFGTGFCQQIKAGIGFGHSQ